MTTAVERIPAVASLRRAAVRATRAPSVHNTQPWRMLILADRMRLFADPARRLRILDPRGRQLTISCGCALLNARVSLAGAGHAARVTRFPNDFDPGELAEVSVVPGVADLDLARLDFAIEHRRTNRRRFGDEPVPAEVIDALICAARREGADLVPVVAPLHRLAVARLSRQADALENADPAYRAELRAWTTNDPSRADGVPAFAVPHVTGESGDEIPLRDFDTHGAGWLPTRTRSSMSQALLLLTTAGDTARDWLRAGEALERVLLEVTARGYAASPFTSLIEVARTRAELIDELGLQAFPHVLVRVGRAPAAEPTRRRRLGDVLTEIAGSETMPS